MELTRSYDARGRDGKRLISQKIYPLGIKIKCRFRLPRGTRWILILRERYFLGLTMSWVCLVNQQGVEVPPVLHGPEILEELLQHYCELIEEHRVTVVPIGSLCKPIPLLFE